MKNKNMILILSSIAICCFLISVPIGGELKEEPLLKKFYLDQRKKNFSKHKLVPMLRIEDENLSEPERLRSFYFALDKIVGLKEARDLLIEVSRDLMTDLNSTSSIRNYLPNYPVKSKDLNLRLDFSIDIKKMAQAHVVEIALKNGVIQYTLTSDPVWKFTTFTETWEEAEKEAGVMNK